MDRAEPQSARRAFVARLLGLCGLAIIAVPAMADDDDVDAATAKRLRETGAILPLEKILERARRVHAGKVLDTELERKYDRYVYEIEILDERGVAWKMKYDAATGELLKVKIDD